MAKANEQRQEKANEQQQEKKPTPLQKAVEGVGKWWDELRIGDGHAAAMGRLGLKELRNAVSPSRDSVADNEIGVFGSQTQGEIASARGGPGSGPEQESGGHGQEKGESKLSLEELRGHARERAREAERNMVERGQQREHGGMEM